MLAFILAGGHADFSYNFGLTNTNTSSVGTKTMLAGSPGYQSPDQLRAESIGVECDVYAFGGVTESALWPGLSYFQIMTSNVKPNTEVLPSSFKKDLQYMLAGLHSNSSRTVSQDICISIPQTLVHSCHEFISFLC